MRLSVPQAPFVLAGAAALVLAACSPEPSTGAGVDAGASTAAPDLPAPAASGSASGQPAVTDAIPATLHGRWGLVPADCTSGRGDAKGLLVVAPTRLTFYESVAELGALKAMTATSVTGTFAFSGEGQSWMLDMTLASADEGKTMVRTDQGPDGAPSPLTYTKCP